jgi:hypothetical protein
MAADETCRACNEDVHRAAEGFAGARTPSACPLSEKKSSVIAAMPC